MNGQAVSANDEVLAGIESIGTTLRVVLETQRRQLQLLNALVELLTPHEPADGEPSIKDLLQAILARLGEQSEMLEHIAAGVGGRSQSGARYDATAYQNGSLRR